MGFDPQFWITIGAATTATGTALGLYFKYKVEKLRAQNRVELIRETLREAAPQERPPIIEALARLEHATAPVESAPAAKALGAAARSVTRRGRPAKAPPDDGDAS
ncbi:hypothetical protein AB0M02_14880 [Actinoplanes sp. NPDC051861]|uniref:hypothetical protein n=1 Tax=Actinoplanes sp. NPDC051861 TaxID=3155170 RepID=UPI003411FA18